MADDQTQIIRIVIDASAAKSGSDDVKQGLKGVETQAKATAEAVDKAQGTLGTMAEYARNFIALKIGEYIGGIAASAIEAAEQIRNLSTELGMSTDFFQASKAAALANGVTLQELETGYMRFSRTVGQAVDGNKAAITMFNRMGVQILDAGGNLRSTESILVDWAQALQKIHDPAMQAVDAQTAMGRGGQRLLPMFASMSDGIDSFVARAKQMGVVINDDAIEQLRKLQQQTQLTKLQLQAVFDNTVAGPLTWFWNANLNAARIMLGLLGEIGDKINSWGKSYSISDWVTANLIAPIAGAVSAVGTLFTGLGKVIEAVFVQSFDNVLITVQTAVNKIADGINSVAKDHPGLAKALGLDGGVGHISIAPDHPANAPAEISGLLSKIGASYASGRDAVLTGLHDRQSIRDQAQMAQDEAAARGGSKLSVVEPGGSRNPAIVDHKSQNLQSTLAKLSTDAQINLDGATAMAQAANDGADAVAKLETHTKDLKAVTDAYTKAGITNKAAIDAQVASLDKLNDATRVQNNLKTFVLATGDMKTANDDSALQLQLAGQTTEEIARQLAQKKAYDDEVKQGLIAAAAGNDDAAAAAQKAISDRSTAIDQQYRIKTAIDETAKSQQMWLQPFSQAVNSVQSGFESFFENILTTGKTSWQTLADTFKQIFIKLLAELAALAIARPIIQPIVQSIFSPGAAQSLGFGGGGGLGLGSIFSGGGFMPGEQGGVPSIGGAGFGGGSIRGLFSGGSSSALGSFGEWLNTPFIGTSYGGAGSYDSIGDLISSGAPGLTPMGAIGGIGSIGMGIASLIGGNGSAGSMLGGASGILGGGLGMMAALVPGMAALGPVGMGIGLVGGILGSILGGSSVPPIPPQPVTSLGTGSFRFTNLDGSAAIGGESINGGAALNQQAGSVAGSVLALMTQAGLTGVAGKMYGGNIVAGTNYNNLDPRSRQWIAQNYTQAELVDPSGNVNYLDYNDTTRNLQQQSDFLGAQVFKANALYGGTTGASSTLLTALANMNPQTVSDAQNIITMSQKYDNALKGDNLTQAEQSLQSINNDFASLIGWAQQMGVAIQPLEDAQTAQKLKLATDFSKQITDGITGITDPLKAQLDQLNDAYQNAVKEAQYMNDNISGAFIDMADVSKYYTLQMEQAQQQFYASAVSSIEQAILSMTYGDLSGASPIDTLSGTKATYMATLAQARAGDSTAINNLAADATAYVQAGKAYYGTSTDFADLVSQVRAALADEQASLQTAPTPGSSTDVSTAAANAVLQSNSDLSNTITQQQQQIAALTDQLANLTAQLQRLAVNRLAA